MLEYPEIQTVTAQLSHAVCGCNVSGTYNTAVKKIISVLPPAKPHKFCWFAGDPALYENVLKGTHPVSTEGHGIFADLLFDNGCRLSFNDGVTVRLYDNASDAPENYQLQILFSDNSALVFTVSMYGGIVLHDSSYDNEYYRKSLASPDPFSSAFEELYRKNLSECKGSMSAKAFLATDQHFSGIGNGCIQDILFHAGINPRKKLVSLSQTDTDSLFSSLRDTLRAMTDGSGRDTEKDLFGNYGSYPVEMGKKALAKGCPCCGSPVTKEAFLGGSVYYCPHCQPL